MRQLLQLAVQAVLAMAGKARRINCITIIFIWLNLGWFLVFGCRCKIRQKRNGEFLSAREQCSAGLASFSMIGFEAAVTLVPALLCIGLFGINLGNETLFANRCFDHLLVRQGSVQR